MYKAATCNIFSNKSSVHLKVTSWEIVFHLMKTSFSFYKISDLQDVKSLLAANEIPYSGTPDVKMPEKINSDAIGF